MGFVGGRGGGGKPKPSKVGSKVRRANKKAAEQGPRDAEMLVPGGSEAGAESVDLQAVDWDKVGGWSKVKYDPNRLIFGAQEEGFVELEEMDMNDLDLSKLTPSAIAQSGQSGGASKRAGPLSKGGADPSRRLATGFETVDLADFEDHDGDFGEDDPAHFASNSEDGENPPRETKADARHAIAKETPKTQKRDASSEKGTTLSAKEARIEKRKARWKAKVEAAKAKKAAARAEAGHEAHQPLKEYQTRDERDAKDAKTTRRVGESRDEPEPAPNPRVLSTTDSARTAAATGSAKDAGWQMDYNNYPTAGFGAVVDGVDLDSGADVSNWLEFDLHPKLMRALQDMGFTDPTPIQREALNPAVKGRCDVIGAAETGSGKTLAFGLPILHRLLTQADAEAADGSDESGDEIPAETRVDDDALSESNSESDPFADVVDEFGRSGAGAGFTLPARRKALRALIVTPTRELAMQVCAMLKAVAKHAPEVGITPVVGGMSLQKQERLLRRRPEIVVATPGRLWELMHQQGHEHFLDLGRLNFLVLDEADRMVERGHFAELRNIIDILPMPPRVKRPPGAAKATPETLKVFKKRGPAPAPANGGKRGGKGMKGGNAPAADGDVVESVAAQPRGADDAKRDGDGADGAEISLRPSQMLDRQTFVFSATLTVPDGVRRKLKRGRHVSDGNKVNDKKEKEKGAVASQTLSGLMEAVPFYGRVKLVDLTDQSRTVAERVAESALECTEDERDALLYHILTQQPGLVIVFVNAISALRRLLSLLKILQLPVEGLHGNMQQRARLKYLDRFRAAAFSEGTNESSEVNVSRNVAGGEKKRTSVLVATDVAARGIDIKGVDLVVHYQVPTSADTYVHRSGRTGRARAEGASVVLVTPGERTRYRALLRALKRDGSPLPAFPTVETAVAEARRRLSLAKRLDKIAHAKQRDAADAEWRRANAAELGIELDSDEDADADAVLVFNAADKKAKSKMAQKAQRAFERVKRRAARRADGADGADGGASDGSESDSESEDFADARMAELVDAGFDQDDQASAARLGEYRRLGREEAKLRADLAELLKTPLGVKAGRRAGVASARYPSRGEGAARMAVEAREKHGAGDFARGKDGSEAASAVDMLKKGGAAAARVGAAPGGAAGKKRKRAKVAPGNAR